MAKSTTQPLASLVATPHEVVEQALAYCHPYDVHSFGLTCRFAYGVVYGRASSYLWRQLYLRYPFDDPLQSLRARHDPNFIFHFDWKCELQRRIKSSKPAVCGTNGELAEPPRVLKDKLATYLSVVRAASPVPKDSTNVPSHDLRWLEAILPALDSWHVSSSGLDEELLQLLAELRSCFALSLSHCLQPSAVLDTRRTQSRCYVYDLQNYRDEMGWGPFLCGGQVNWIHIEAIIIVILRNLVGFPLRPLTPPLGLRASRAYSAPDVLANEQTDWAGVQGTWARYVSFVDYRLLHEFNYSVANGHPLQYFFDNLPDAEATRLFRLDLRIVRRYGVSMATEDSPYPPLHFIGTPKGAISSRASVEGTVRMGADGVVRWQFRSSYDSITAWWYNLVSAVIFSHSHTGHDSSEGIQLGNVASALGVVGIWSGGRRAPGEPVGPFWMWRVRSDEFLNVH